MEKSISKCIDVQHRQSGPAAPTSPIYCLTANGFSGAMEAGVRRDRDPVIRHWMAPRGRERVGHL
jgi:hypothetical protein